MAARVFEREHSAVRGSQKLFVQSQMFSRLLKRRGYISYRILLFCREARYSLGTPLANAWPFPSTHTQEKL